MIHYTTTENAVSCIKSGNRVFIQSAVMAPHQLINAMVARADKLRNVEIVHIHTEGGAPYTDSKYTKSFYTRAFFIGANTRKAVQSGEADYIPLFLSEVPFLFRKGIMPIDVAMIQVSPPDNHGYCSLGVSVDVTLAAVQSAKYVIAQINPNVPRTHGDGIIHIRNIHAGVQVNEPIIEIPANKISAVEKKIGTLIAELIEDGATLQMGIGAVPDAVLAELTNHKRLGIHTEMFAEGVIDLVEKGVITGEEKNVLPRKIVACFAMGTRRLYDFVDDNPLIVMKSAEYTNDTARIRRNPKVTAINSAIEVDLTGQVCADTIGTVMYSGVGGQIDFIRGASHSEGGKPIIALPSTTSFGASKIVPTLKEGADVTTTRAHVHYIVTEYGIAYLHGKSLRQRVKALIEIAHPNHRESLEKSAFGLFKKL